MVGVVGLLTARISAILLAFFFGSPLSENRTNYRLKAEETEEIHELIPLLEKRKWLRSKALDNFRGEIGT
jgi:hypothetical protein